MGTLSHDVFKFFLVVVVFFKCLKEEILTLHASRIILEASKYPRDL
jgi:hypothetical protein